MNWTPLNLTVRVGCNLSYETPVPTPVLFVLRPRLEGRVLVMQEKLSFGIGQPSYEFQDSHGNITVFEEWINSRVVTAATFNYNYQNHLTTCTRINWAI
jgi:hypothetical protein